MKQPSFTKTPHWAHLAQSFCLALGGLMTAPAPTPSPAQILSQFNALLTNLPQRLFHQTQQADSKIHVDVQNLKAIMTTES